MDQCTQEVRMQYWKNIILQCQAGPADQTAKQWMTENGICGQTYYLWQRRIRREAYEQMSSQELLPGVSEKEEITFAEITVPEDKQRDCYPDTQEPVIHPVAVIKTNCCSIALSADIPEVLLSRILKEVSHACGCSRYPPCGTCLRQGGFAQGNRRTFHDCRG